MNNTITVAGSLVTLLSTVLAACTVAPTELSHRVVASCEAAGAPWLANERTSFEADYGFRYCRGESAAGTLEIKMWVWSTRERPLIPDHAESVPDPERIVQRPVDELWEYGWQDLNYVIDEYKQGPVRGYGLLANNHGLWIQIEAENTDPDIDLIPDGPVIVFGYNNFEIVRKLFNKMLANVERDSQRPQP